MMRCLVAALVALVALTGCAPIYEPPRDAQGNLLPSMVFEALSEPSGKRVNIIVDAVDQFGGHGTNADTGLPYPWDTGRRTPYRHTIYYQPGVIVSVRFEVILATNEGDVVGCKVFDQGVEIKLGAQVAQIAVGAVSSRVTCIYTTPGA